MLIQNGGGKDNRPSSDLAPGFHCDLELVFAGLDMKNILGPHLGSEPLHLLKAHLEQIEETKRRDHRRLAKDLDLFSLGGDIGAGLVYWHPKGAFIRHQLEEFWKEEHWKRGYELVYTPHIGAGKLYEKSGHFQYYLLVYHKDPKRHQLTLSSEHLDDLQNFR